jgi:hypothetical protein
MVELYGMEKIWYGRLGFLHCLLLGGTPRGYLFVSSMFAGRWRTMVCQNPANKGVIAKIFFLNDLGLKCEAPAIAEAFS